MMVEGRLRNVQSQSPVTDELSVKVLLVALVESPVRDESSVARIDRAKGTRTFYPSESLDPSLVRIGNITDICYRVRTMFL
jgi:hypothetical protein